MAFKIISQVINNYDVTISITVDDDPQYGYGYGWSSIDYFDVFGVPGNFSGYFLSETLGEVPQMPDYDYGWGCEYTDIIADGMTSKKVSVEITSDLAPADENFNLRIYIVGNGYSDTYSLNNVKKDEVNSFYVYKRNVESGEEFIGFHDDTSDTTWLGTKYLYNRDSYFDVIIEVLDSLDNYPTIAIQSDILDSEVVSKTITVFGTVT